MLLNVNCTSRIRVNTAHGCQSVRRYVVSKGGGGLLINWVMLITEMHTSSSVTHVLLLCSVELCHSHRGMLSVLSQDAFGEAWQLYDLGLLVATVICLITYAAYIQTMMGFSPPDTYEVYDSLGGAQARVLLPKKVDPTSWNSKSYLVSCTKD